MSATNELDTITSIRNEQIILRGELQELKRCQLQYFVLSLAATGAVLSFSGNYLGGMVYLAPLLIITPCCWTFFDKATTITRLVGYTRVFIENQLAGKTPIIYMGYENALSAFRFMENMESERVRSEKPKNNQTEQSGKKSLAKARHRYWSINFYTFLGLSIACLLFTSFGGHNYSAIHIGVIVVAWLAVGVSLFFIYANVKRLISGVYSFDNFTKSWEIILKNERDSRTNSIPS